MGKHPVRDSVVWLTSLRHGSRFRKRQIVYQLQALARRNSDARLSQLVFAPYPNRVELHSGLLEVNAAKVPVNETMYNRWVQRPVVTITPLICIV